MDIGKIIEGITSVKLNMVYILKEILGIMPYAFLLLARI